MKGLKVLMLAGFLLFLAVLLLVITLGLALPVALPLIFIALAMFGVGIARRNAPRERQEHGESER